MTCSRLISNKDDIIVSIVLLTTDKIVLVQHHKDKSV